MNIPHDAKVEVLSFAEGRALVEAKGLPKSIASSLRNIHFCKAERYAGFVYGTIAAPKKVDGRETQVFAFFLNEEHLLLLDDQGLAKTLLARAQEDGWRTKVEALGTILDELIENDLAYLQALENRLISYEEKMMAGEYEDFAGWFMPLNRKITTFIRYYSQLVDLCDTLLASSLINDNDRIYLRRLSDRCERLESEAQMLRESLNQLRGEYQAQIGIKQNSIMQILTVVTLIFMPLTLIVGWYGMNLCMPEVAWPYSYPVVILVSILVSIGTVWLCKRKGFF